MRHIHLPTSKLSRCNREMSCRIFLRLSGLFMAACLVSRLSAQPIHAELDARDLFLRQTAPVGSNSSIKQTESKEGPESFLGVRYAIRLRTSEGKTMPVSPERIFSDGECFSIEIQTNRNGYVYLISEGASGHWSILYPSKADASESIAISAGSTIEIPQEGCLEFKPPSGVERMFLFLSNEIEQVDRLLQLFELSSLGRSNNSQIQTGKIRPPDPKVKEELAARDLGLKTIGGEQQSGGERPFTVYAVARPPRLFFEIALKHK